MLSVMCCVDAMFGSDSCGLVGRRNINCLGFFCVTDGVAVDGWNFAMLL